MATECRQMWRAFVPVHLIAAQIKTSRNALSINRYVCVYLNHMTNLIDGWMGGRWQFYSQHQRWQCPCGHSSESIYSSDSLQIALAFLRRAHGRSSQCVYGMQAQEWRWQSFALDAVCSIRLGHGPIRNIIRRAFDFTHDKIWFAWLTFDINQTALGRNLLKPYLMSNWVCKTSTISEWNFRSNICTCTQRQTVTDHLWLWNVRYVVLCITPLRTVVSADVNSIRFGMLSPTRLMSALIAFSQRHRGPDIFDYNRISLRCQNKRIVIYKHTNSTGLQTHIKHIRFSNEWRQTMPTAIKSLTPENFASQSHPLAPNLQVPATFISAVNIRNKLKNNEKTTEMSNGTANPSSNSIDGKLIDTPISMSVL